jgi:hypothetical protein
LQSTPPQLAVGHATRQQRCILLIHPHFPILFSITFTSPPALLRAPCLSAAIATSAATSVSTPPHYTTRTRVAGNGGRSRMALGEYPNCLHLRSGMHRTPGCQAHGRLKARPSGTQGAHQRRQQCCSHRY